MTAPRRPAHLLVLVLFVTSCMVPYQQGPYQQGPYGQGQNGYSSGGSASYAMRVVYEPPTKKPQRDEIRKFLQTTKTFEKTSHALGLMFDLPQDVTVVWKECGSVNASWDGQGNIVMCYEMAEFLKALFVKKVKGQQQLRAAVMSSLMFVFLHEMGHGLISLYKLPAVGREEDAADQLAALVLIEMGGDAGVEVAMHGAQFFRLLAQTTTKAYFFDEHSLDAQRYYNLLCLVYGSSPQRLGSMVGNDKLPASRARRCPTEYSKASTAWASLLGGHVRKRGNRSAPNRSDTDTPRSSGDAGGWSCRAVGSYAPGGSSGPDYGDPQNVEATESGGTRDEAGYAAIKSCSGMLNLSTNTEIYPGSLRTQECEVVSCSR